MRVTRQFCQGMAVVAMLLALYPSPASAQVYRWVDANGNVHYGDRPADGAKTLDIPSAATTDPGGLRDGERQRLETIRARRERRTTRDDDTEPRPRASNAGAPDCEVHTRQYRQAQQQLRAGYRPSEGDALRRRVRASMAAMNRHCR